VRVVPAKGWGVSDPYGCASGRYGSGEYHHYVSCQVDADGNPSSSDLIATLASDVRVTGAPSEVPGPNQLPLLAAGIAATLLATRKRARDSEWWRQLSRRC